MSPIYWELQEENEKTNKSIDFSDTAPADRVFARNESVNENQNRSKTLSRTNNIREIVRNLMVFT